MRDLDVGNGLIIPAAALSASTSRSGGPGGQNVNKLETKVTIETDVATLPLPDEVKEKIRQRLATRINKEGVLRVTSQSERSQLANRDKALARMEELVRGALVERIKRKRTRPTRAQKQKRLEAKKRRGETKKLRGTRKHEG